MYFSCWVHPKQHLYRATPLNSIDRFSPLLEGCKSILEVCSMWNFNFQNSKENEDMHHNISQHRTSQNQNRRSAEQMTGSFVFKDHLEVLEGASASTFLKAVSTAPTCDGLRCQKTLPFVKSSLSWIQLFLSSAEKPKVERKKNLLFSNSKAKKMIWTLELQPVDDNHHFLPQQSPPPHNPPPGVS